MPHRMHPRSRWRKLLNVVPRRYDCSPQRVLSTVAFAACSTAKTYHLRNLWESKLYLRSALVWAITQRMVLICCRGFGTPYWSQSPLLSGESLKSNLSLYDRRRRKTWSGESFCTTWMLVAEVLWTIALCIVLSYFQCIRLTYPSRWQLICIRVSHSTCSCW
jgi:hypothetical protein